MTEITDRLNELVKARDDLTNEKNKLLPRLHTKKNLILHVVLSKLVELDNEIVRESEKVKILKRELESEEGQKRELERKRIELEKIKERKRIELETRMILSGGCCIAIK